MKVVIGVLFVFLISLEHSIAECPPGQHDPGPDCAFEVICPLPTAHTARRHYCDCWCDAGLVRDSITNQCVKVEDCSELKPGYSYGYS